MRRFFLEQQVFNDEISLSKREKHHMVNVFRFKPGVEVELFDVEGYEYIAQVIACDKKEIKLRILSKKYKKEEKKLKIYLAQGLIKTKKWDLLLQKSMELGLHCLYPVLTKNLASGANTAGRCERWNKVLISAAKQSGRNSLIDIKPIKTFEEVLEESKKFDIKILAHNDSSLPHLKNVLDSYEKNFNKDMVMIGPEGGFTEKEIELARQNNITLFSLGSYILRAETAAIAIIANLNFYNSPKTSE